MLKTKYITCLRLLCFSFAIILTIFSSTVSEEARQGIELCLKTVIPSLFPIFVLNGLIVRLSVANLLPNKLKRLLSAIFGTPNSAALPLTVALLSGAPSGVIALSSLYDSGKLTADDAERSALACSPLSFAFVYGGIGIGMLGSKRLGAILYLIQLISVAVTSRLMNFGVKKEKATGDSDEVNVVSLSCAFTSSLKGALDGITGVCGAVVFFSVLSGIVFSIPHLPSSIKIALSLMLEITSGASFACGELGGEALFVCICGAVGWSGLSVIMQCANASSGRFGVGRLYVGKVITALFCVIGGVLAVFLGVA